MMQSSTQIIEGKDKKMHEQLDIFGGSDRVASLQEIAKERFENIDSSLPNIISYGGVRTLLQ
jgi:hypothetical protein